MAIGMKFDTNPNTMPSLPDYVPPTKGPLSLLPATWVPYAQLMRIEKPAGYFAFYFPHIAGLLFAQSHAANLSFPRPSFEQRLVPHLYVLSGCLFLRGAACTWNDFLDAPYDRQVARCRLRPIARNAVSGPAALGFMAIQTVLGVLTTLAPLPHSARAPAALLSATQIVYPLCKRFTDYPQLWLGVSFAFGVGVGAGAGGIDFVEMCGRLDALEGSETRILCTLDCLYFFVVLNTLIYDTIYGHQDLKDDLKAGVKSLAVAWRDNTKRNCTGLAVIEIALLLATSILGRLTMGFDILAIGGTTLVLIVMLYSVKLEDPESCMSCFKWLIWGTGATLSLGLLSS
ncbi:hypothetical protein BELL_0283g00070 [Botrytis elliptica]|uniref:Uncharacterized protein n=1 Tax=Botrytis elliptica TaxID=278938 RepID=A0A4Z1JT97_9HELO|nr:hypothetical protein EAE99_001997 [Botrytis elliptica]TGO74432.1 hypothetical protein BELL_0283g00070 [Botrytis elliptica]